MPTAHRPHPTTAGAACVVHFTDVVSRGVTGRGGCEYHSPPHSREQALALVELLLGCPVRSPAGREKATWTRAIAGGRRTISLTGA